MFQVSFGVGVHSTKGLFPIKLIVNLPLLQKLLTYKKCIQASFSFSPENVCWDV